MKTKFRFIKVSALNQSGCSLFNHYHRKHVARGIRSPMIVTSSFPKLIAVSLQQLSESPYPCFKIDSRCYQVSRARLLDDLLETSPSHLPPFRGPGVNSISAFLSGSAATPPFVNRISNFRSWWLWYRRLLNSLFTAGDYDAEYVGTSSIYLRSGCAVRG